ncbi:serine/arginine repetitive matrix protein 1 isoform X2 [Rosa chinensis]|uniref:serine/arginine repetitive matrix protein 1 isoform X2 n=1 Tax=Rosa chinensis TaxID=74649 RepID=UPI000D09774B|nr:serine/arginine repetitive matrix protein 1 isoform X2 [Rosa chinensis]
MSGGFFRGTSADQDTRFSNKQAKLLKSQKFAPELEHLVDMRKVNMDVLRPWIANRVTELLGFEDEVLINFIYGLLDVKEVNGKEIQISLTGFMEKNTVKFMRELWTLLLSAQNNASGVPQQFLDAKQEEARKKKEEADAIETQRKKDKETLELERSKKMDGGVDKKSSNAALEPNSNRVSPMASSDRPDDERGNGKRNGVKPSNKVSRSPDSADSDSSLSPRFGERDRSRSVSISPKARGRSISSERGRGYRSPQRRPITPRRRSPEGSLSPKGRSLSPKGRSPYSRRGSRSKSPRRSRSPIVRRARSPYHRRSRSPGRRRSPPPFRSRRSPSPFRGRRSPYRRRRSPSPPRRRRLPSPIRNRRSPSPIRRRRSPSPLRRRTSPLVRRRRSPSPARRRSPSPVRSSYRRSPRNRYASPLQRRSPVRGGRRSPPLRRRSPSPSDRSSSSPIRRDSPSPIRRTTKQQRSPLQSHQERTRSIENLSPAPQQSSGSEGSLQRESKNGNDYRKRVAALSPSPEKSPPMSESPPGARSVREKRRLSSPYESPVKRPREQIAHYGSSSPSRKPREQKLRCDSPKESEEEEDAGRRPQSLERRSRDTSRISKQIISPAKIPNKEEYSPERVASGQRFTESKSYVDNTESRNKEQEMKRGSNVPIVHKDSLPGETQRASNPGEGKKADDKNRSHLKNTKDSEHRKPGSLRSSVEMIDHSNQSGGLDSGSEDSDKGRSEDKEKRKNKRSERQEVTSDDDYSYDSAIEDRKEAKRRRKEEKRLRKEKKRRRREERRRRREERRAEKQKVKNSSDASGSDGEHVTGRGFHSSDNEEEAVQKKLEIELRKKAIESLKAKKGISQ